MKQNIIVFQLCKELLLQWNKTPKPQRRILAKKIIQPKQQQHYLLSFPSSTGSGEQIVLSWPNRNCLSCLYLNFQLGSSEEEEGKTLKYEIFIRTALVALCSIVPHWFTFKYPMKIFAAVQMRCLHPNVTNGHLTSLSQNTGWSWQGVGMGAKKKQLSHSFFPQCNTTLNSP